MLAEEYNLNSLSLLDCSCLQTEVTQKPTLHKHLFVSGYFKRPKILMRKRNLTVSLFAGLLLLTSCGNNSSDTSPTTFNDTTVTSSDTAKDENVNLIIDIKEIAGKTLADVEKILGKAESKEKVKGYPCKNTDCQRAYFKKGSYEIIFKKSKADRITINQTPDLTSSDNAIQALGIPLSKPSFKNPSTVVRWNNINGINEISFFTDYILVQITNPE